MRLLVKCGIAAPVLLTALLITIGFLHPGYDHATQFISELGAQNAPFAFAMNTGLIIVGLLMIAFAFGMRAADKNIFSMIGFLAIIIAAAGMMIAGIFACDAECSNNSFSGQAHNTAAKLLGFGMVFAPLFFSFSVKNSKLRILGILVFLIAGTFGVAFLVQMYDIPLEDLFYKYLGFMTEIPKGILQRISMGLPFAWMFIAAWKTKE
jgi:hypothetical membrane protein